MDPSQLSRVLFCLGGVPFLLAGTLHALLTVRDIVAGPRAFTPIDDSVREAMQATGLRLTARTSMWLAWQGFNASHGLGAMIFGLTALFLGAYGFELVRSAGFVMPAAVLFALSYLVLAVRFWFYMPILISSAGTACFVLAYLLG